MGRKLKNFGPRQPPRTVNMYFTIKNPKITKASRRCCCGLHKVNHLEQRQKFAYDHLELVDQVIKSLKKELQWTRVAVNCFKDAMVDEAAHRGGQTVPVAEESTPEGLLMIRRQAPPVDSAEGEQLADEGEDNPTSNSSNSVDAERIISQSAPLERNGNPMGNSNNGEMSMAPSRPYSEIPVMSRQYNDAPVAPRPYTEMAIAPRQYVPNPAPPQQQYQQNYNPVVNSTSIQGRMLPPAMQMSRNIPIQNPPLMMSTVNRPPPPRQMLPSTNLNYNNPSYNSNINNTLMDPQPMNTNCMSPAPLVPASMPISAQMSATMSMPSSSMYPNNPVYAQMRSKKRFARGGNSDPTNSQQRSYTLADQHISTVVTDSPEKASPSPPDVFTYPNIVEYSFSTAMSDGEVYLETNSSTAVSPASSVMNKSYQRVPFPTAESHSYLVETPVDVEKKLEKKTEQVNKLFETLVIEQEQYLAAEEMQNEMMCWMGDKWKAAEEDKKQLQKENERLEEDKKEVERKLAEKDRLIDELQEMLNRQSTSSSTSSSWRQIVEDEKKACFEAAKLYDVAVGEAMDMMEKHQQTLAATQQHVKTLHLDKEILQHAIKHWLAITNKVVDKMAIFKNQLDDQAETEKMEQMLMAMAEEMGKQDIFMED